MKRHLLLSLLAIIGIAVPAAAAHHVITFDDQIELPLGRHDVTIGQVTLRGGQVSDLLYEPAWTSRSFWTREYDPSLGFQPIIDIEFAVPVANISFDFLNGAYRGDPDGPRQPGNVNYSFGDDHGNFQHVSIPPWTGNGDGSNIIRRYQFGGANIKKLTIAAPATDTGGWWDFAIDNLSYDDDSCGVSAQDTTRPQCDLERIVIAIDGETDAGGNQIYHLQNVSSNMKVRVPFGSRFSVTIQRRNAQGEFAGVNAIFGAGNDVISPPLPTQFNRLSRVTPLYPFEVVGTFDVLAPPSPSKRFQVLHAGTVKILVKPTDRPNDDPFTALDVTAYFPTALGRATTIPRYGGVANVMRYDSRLIGFAHERGIPPQYFKGQIEQETADSARDFFNPMSWRYEPITVDCGHPYSGNPPSSVSVANPSASQQDSLDLIHKEPFRNFALPNGANLSRDDISPRSVLDVCIGGKYVPIPEGVNPTARQIVDANNVRKKMNWTRDQPDPSPRPAATCGTTPQPPGKHRAAAPVPDRLNFTAQTPLASSYGLLQLIHAYVFGGPYYWTGVDGGTDPALLFDTDENLADDDRAGTEQLGAGAGTLRVGATKDLYLFRLFETPGTSFEFDFDNETQYDDALEDTFDHYPGNGAAQNYGQHVVAEYSPSYLPQVSGDVFTTSCAPPVAMSQSQGGSVTPGSPTLLGFNIFSSTAATYDWYVVNGSTRTRIDGTDALLEARPMQTTTYIAVATNDCGSISSAPITVTVKPPCTLPVITTQPAATLAATAAVLAVVGPPDAAYQWIFVDKLAGPTDSIPAEAVVAGGNGATITVPRSGDAIRYAVWVSNGCGAILSAPITVPAAASCPLITDASASSGNGSVAPGTPVTLTATATGDGLSYQWFAANDLPVGSGATVTVSPAVTTRYYAVVTNACGSTRSGLVTVNVSCNAPVITAQPQSVQMTVGTSAQLSIAVTGATSIQWFDGSGNPAGSGASINVSPAVNTAFHARATNACGSVDSASATVTVVAACTPLTITQQPPAEQTIIVGQSAGFMSVGVTGTSPHFQWYIHDRISGADSPIGGATLPNYTTSQPGDYFCRITNDCSSVDSNISTVLSGVICGPAGIFNVTEDQTITAGDSITLTVVASGSSPYSYQWFQLFPDGTQTAIDTGRDFTVTPTVDVTRYYVTVTNNCGAASSRPITITLCHPPAIAQQPVAPVFHAPGESAQISVVATGTNLHYAWFANNAPLADDAPSITIFAPSIATSYSVEISGDCGSITSQAVVVIPPCIPPSITTQPISQNISAGGSATLQLAASGTTPLTVSWFTADGTTAGTGPSIGVSPSATTSYYATVTNSCGTATSSTVTVTVTASCIAPSITRQPQSVTITQGSSTTLSVTATGDPTLLYQWHTSAGVAVPGGTSVSVTVAPLQTQSYYVVVTNGCGSITSNVVTVTVQCLPPQITSEPPSSVTITAGQITTLTVTAIGSLLHTQWFEQFPTESSPHSVVNGVDTFTLTVGGNDTPSGTKYTCRVFNGCGSATSDPTTLIIH